MPPDPPTDDTDADDPGELERVVEEDEDQSLDQDEERDRH